MTASKSAANASIKDSVSGLKANVELKSDGINNGLHVISELENNIGGYTSIPVVNGAKYKSTFSAIEIPLINTGTGTSVFQLTGAGVLEYFNLHLEDKKTTVYLFIDGVQRYALDCEGLEMMDVQSSISGDHPVQYGKATKNFKHYPKFPLKYNSSFQIKAKADAKKVKEWIVTYIED